MDGNGPPHRPPSGFSISTIRPNTAAGAWRPPAMSAIASLLEGKRISTGRLHLWGHGLRPGSAAYQRWVPWIRAL